MNRHKFWRGNPLLPMILWWIGGLILGFVFPLGLDYLYVSWMRLSYYSQVSIVWVALTAVIPFFISAFLATIDRYFLVSILLFLRSILQGFSLGAILASFQCSAWLMGFLSLLPELLCCTVLLVYAFHWRCQHSVSVGDLMMGSGWLLLSVCLEYWILSPLRMAILNV